MKYNLHRIKCCITTVLLALPLVVKGQDKPYYDYDKDAVKVFDLDIDSVYNIYIDSVGTVSGAVEVCFQTTSGKLIRTDREGAVLSTKTNPYTYFTFFEGDTLILKDSTVVNTIGDTIAVAMYSDGNLMQCHYIAASQYGIYVFVGNKISSPMHSYSEQVQNVMGIGGYEGTGILYFVRGVSGLCVYRNVLYSFRSSQDYNSGSLSWRNEQYNEFRGGGEVNIGRPAGIAGYGDFLYIFSNTDKALYRIEVPQESLLTPEVVQTSSHGPIMNDVLDDAINTTLYNIGGQKTDSSSEFKIVVTRNSDGTIRTEKKLF